MLGNVKARDIPLLSSVQLVHMAFIVSFLIASCRSSTTGSGPLIDFQLTQPPAVPVVRKQYILFVVGSPKQEVDHLLTVELSEILLEIWGNITSTPDGLRITRKLGGGNVELDRNIWWCKTVKVWRTSTPEPTPSGILWTYIKDVTRYIPLFSTPGTLILDLNNLIEPNQNLTGNYNVNLSATFYESSVAHPPAPKANIIFPISNLSPNMANYVSVPPAFSLNITFPTNMVEAYVELYASGNGNEEFWYSNVDNRFLNHLPSGTTFGNGPFREVRLLVDGMIAGVAFPYAVFFTGADVPDAWRPITSYGALDLPTYYIDLTPFVPLLSNGKPHNVTLDVVSAEGNHTINDNWFVSGNIQVVTDTSGKPTTGKITLYDVPEFPVSSTKGVLSHNGDLTVTVNASRQLRIESEIRSGSGKTNTVIWQQDLSYTNLQLYQQNASIQVRFFKE
ncbi:hypothetical protein Clacol_000008 [Clathrus columnatus]|uniref:Peptide N-acetyl-beta-D-glucosaminyl asparaginase amidase A N-terminal domain-containing protein n=1 Tax=Clathrus columnatus TaxID=1419009 RepID=A0AAV4ZW23_9AGAM|nr:hypothetical protein Clacol_000008 [Clathrus columnatus]